MGIEDNRRNFIAALRSGKYRQIRACYMSMINPDELCALGVASVVCGNERLSSSFCVPRFSGLTVVKYNRFEHRVPEFVMEKLGLTHVEMKLIINMNDYDDYSFSAIADKLEEQWQLKAASTAAPSQP